MSRAHLTLEERIGIEVFCTHGHDCRTIAACPGPPPQYHFQQAAPGQLQIRPNPTPAPGLLVTGPEKDGQGCAAPTDAAGGKAGTAGTEAACPGVSI